MKIIFVLLISLLCTMTVFAEEMIYEIKKWDELMLISKNVYGTYHKWQKILKANPSIHPNYLQIGHKIIIPGASTPKHAEVKSAEDINVTEVAIDEFTEESVLSLLDSNRLPASESFLDSVKKLFKKEPTEDPAEWIELKNESPTGKEGLTVNFQVLIWMDWSLKVAQSARFERATS